MGCDCNIELMHWELKSGLGLGEHQVSGDTNRSEKSVGIAVLAYLFVVRVCHHEMVPGKPWSIFQLQHALRLRVMTSQVEHKVKVQMAKSRKAAESFLLRLQGVNSEFYSKRYCQTHDLAYHSEHARVVAYLRTLDLEDYIGAYDRREVLVLADSGYDNKKIEQAMAAKGWHCIIALSKTRSVKSEALALSTPT